MSTRKITLLSIIAVLLITYIFQLTFESRGKITAVKPKAAITKIEINNLKGNINLVKTDDSWIINSNHPANADLADYILSCLSDIKIIDTVSKSGNSEDLEKYGLNNPISVCGYSADNTEVQKILVGKTSTTGNQTFIKFENKKDIYLVSGNLVIAFNISANDLLDFTLYSIKESDVYKVEKFTGEPKPENKDFTLEKTGEVAAIQWQLNGNDISTDTVQNWLRSIEILTATEWIDDFANLKVDTKPDLSFIIGVAGRNITIRLFDINTESDKVLCICSENNFPCYISKSTSQKYLKESADFE